MESIFNYLTIEKKINRTTTDSTWPGIASVWNYEVYGPASEPFLSARKKH